MIQLLYLVLTVFTLIHVGLQQDAYEDDDIYSGAEVHTLERFKFKAQGRGLW